MPTGTPRDISQTGNVTMTGTGGSTTIQVTLTHFANEAGLQSLGSNLYGEAPASGAPQRATAQNG